jgi:hypothetical protein
LRQKNLLSLLLFVALDPIKFILKKATDQGHLHAIRGRILTTRTSLYVDGADAFVRPRKEDIQFLGSMLASFGDVTGLNTNCQKSFVAPIRCVNIDLDDILQFFPGIRSTFPLRYPGLPLSIHHL